MTRFVDIREADTGYSFSFWDTVRNEYVSFSGEYAWDSWGDFEMAATYQARPPFVDASEMRRFRGLCPDWVFDK